MPDLRRSPFEGVASIAHGKTADAPKDLGGLLAAPLQPYSGQ
jgi:hypothetical protein